MMRAGEPVLLKALKDDGYHVWWGGKNDLVPAQNGYDNYCTVKAERGDVLPMFGKGWRPAKGEPGYYSFYAGCVDKRDAEYYRDADWAFVEAAIEFIRTWDGDEPFCLYLPLTYPHPPYGVEEPWYSITDRAKIPRRRPEPAPQAGKAGILTEMIKRHGITAEDL